jgi:hypothetical protein
MDQEETDTMRIALIGLLALVLTGCGVEVLTATAVQGELQAQQLTAMKRQIGNAAGTTGRINIERAITTYQAEKGVYPPSLDALVPEYLQALPVKPDGSSYGYDPNSGKLLEGTQTGASAGPTPQDNQMIRQIQAAIQQYGQDTGYYPDTLDNLYPNYLTTLPRTSSGEAFVYNNQNGYVAHPGAMPAARPAPQAGSMGGAGPMGEAMTGIGMSQQLDSMNQSGASGTGSYARDKIGGATTDHNDRQNKAMDDLGL